MPYTYSPADYEGLKKFVQFGSFLLSIFFNLVLIILVLVKSPKKMGSYKYLMCYFSTFAMFFSTVDIILQPYLISYGTCAIVISDLRDSPLTPHECLILISTLCGCFGGVISSIAIHFVFRYFAMERRGKLKYFEGAYLVWWLAIPSFLTVIWSGFTYYFLQPTSDTDDYMRNHLEEIYGLDVNQSSYIATMYYPFDKDGKEYLNTFIFPCVIFFGSVINVSLIVLFYFGAKSYKQIQRLIYEGSSKFTKNLQKQLYKALVIQACIPLTLLYIPIGIFIFFPFFRIDLGSFSTFVTFVYAIYPAVDPLPVIFIVDNYRCSVLRILCGAENRVDVQEEATNVSASVP